MGFEIGVKRRDFGRSTAAKPSMRQPAEDARQDQKRVSFGDRH
jgi:hypothetical protein